MAFSPSETKNPPGATTLSWVFHQVLSDQYLISLLFSIVAVHGLSGDWERTWTDEDGQLWLRDFLPSQLPNARIMSYGYNSETVFSKAITDIDDEAAMLLDWLDGERQSEKIRPIIFVSHNLGGIVVKKVGLPCTWVHYQVEGF